MKLYTNEETQRTDSGNLEIVAKRTVSNINVMLTKRGGSLDSIKRKLRAVQHTVIKIQMDGATPHTGKGNRDKLRAASSAGGWNIVFDFQPSNSPDSNKLNLFKSACSKCY